MPPDTPLYFHFGPFGFAPTKASIQRPFRKMTTAYDSFASSISDMQKNMNENRVESRAVQYIQYVIIYIWYILVYIIIIITIIAIIAITSIVIIIIITIIITIRFYIYICAYAYNISKII